MYRKYDGLAQELLDIQRVIYSDVGVKIVDEMRFLEDKNSNPMVDMYMEKLTEKNGYMKIGINNENVVSVFKKRFEEKQKNIDHHKNWEKLKLQQQKKLKIKSNENVIFM